MAPTHKWGRLGFGLRQVRKVMQHHHGVPNIPHTASRDVDTANAFIGGLGNNATLVVVNEGEEDSADSLTPHVHMQQNPPKAHTLTRHDLPDLLPRV